MISKFNKSPAGQEEKAPSKVGGDRDRSIPSLKSPQRDGHLYYEDLKKVAGNSTNNTKGEHPTTI